MLFCQETKLHSLHSYMVCKRLSTFLLPRTASESGSCSLSAQNGSTWASEIEQIVEIEEIETFSNIPRGLGLPSSYFPASTTCPLQVNTVSTGSRDHLSFCWKPARRAWTMALMVRFAQTPPARALAAARRPARSG